MALLVGILCPATGAVLITHRRLLQANLISHAVVPGIILALSIGVDPALGGIISGLIGAFVAERLAFAEVAGGGETLDAPMEETYSLFGLDPSITSEVTVLKIFLYFKLLIDLLCSISLKASPSSTTKAFLITFSCVMLLPKTFILST